MKVLQATVLKNEKIIDNIFDITLLANEIAQEAKCGQFVNFYCKSGDKILPRPLSICEIDKERGTLRVVYAVVGKGTEEFAQLKPNDTIKIMGALGNGFAVSSNVLEHLIVGGGIGTPPLLELTKSLRGNVTVVLGFRSNPILVEAFEKLGATVLVATDDGSVGVKGNVITVLNSLDKTFDHLYACGPTVMLNAVSKWANEKKIDAQVSLEERMACAIGACVGCVVKIKDATSAGEFSYKKVCKDGPVFKSDEVIFDE